MQDSKQAKPNKQNRKPFQKPNFHWGEKKSPKPKQKTGILKLREKIFTETTEEEGRYHYKRNLRKAWL